MCGRGSWAVKVWVALLCLTLSPRAFAETCVDEIGELSDISEITSPGGRVRLPTMDELVQVVVGVDLGAFATDRVIGAGGESVIFRGHRIGSNDEVAIRVLRPPPRGRAFPANAAREGALLQGIANGNHPGRVYIDVPLFVGDRVLVTPYHRNSRTLQQVLDSQATTPQQRAEWFRMILLATEAVHAHNYTHRDIKPDNVLVLEDGTLRLIDFGVARRTGTSTLHPMRDNHPIQMGTLSYMPPGLFVPHSNPTVARAQDVFAVLRTLRQMLIPQDLGDRKMFTREHRGTPTRIARDLRLSPFSTVHRTPGLARPDALSEMLSAISQHQGFQEVAEVRAALELAQQPGMTVERFYRDVIGRNLNRQAATVRGARAVALEILYDPEGIGQAFLGNTLGIGAAERTRILAHMRDFQRQPEAEPGASFPMDAENPFYDRPLLDRILRSSL